MKKQAEAAPQTNGHEALKKSPQPVELDISTFRIDQNFSLHVQARKKVVMVPVVRPDRQQWVCLHPEWRMPVGLIEDKVNRRTYLVEPSLMPDITEDVLPKMLVAYVNRFGSPGLWAVRLPDENGRIDSFNESALRIVAEYAGQWIRVLCEQATQSYSVLESPPVELPSPKWPEEGFDWMFRNAFKGRVIDSINHPFLQTLRGNLAL